MKKILATALLTSCLFLHVPAVSALGEEKFVFEAKDKEPTEAFKGSFEVPENRNNPNSRMIPIKYVRFPATGENAGPPIVYLAGGPGGSGIRTAKYRRFDMFMALRAYSDVIALDQRGTGASDILPKCVSSQQVSETEQTSDEVFIKKHRDALVECLAYWKAEGVDVAGYNTVENAKDLEALRQHLGAKKVTLWGTSYGSHLAFAAIKQMEDKIDKVILSSAEGLNQTIKMPWRTDAYFDRLQVAVDSQPDAKAAYPDIKALMRRVHDKLEKHPMPLKLQMHGGSTVDFLLQRRGIQLLATGAVSDPQWAAMLLGLYLAVDHDLTPLLEKTLGRFMDVGQPITLRAMSNAMDIASGMTEDKKKEIAEQAQTALLKDYLNFTYHYDGIAPELDLGDDFRAKPVSNIPVLLFSGTLDGRTYIESQKEAVAGLTNLTAITVENAGHNLYMSSPEVQTAINRFMEGKPVLKQIVTIELPNMAPPK